MQLRTGHDSPEGEESYSFTLSLTSALDGVGGQRHASDALPPVPSVQAVRPIGGVEI